MKFEMTSDQRAFAAALDALLTSSDVVTSARAWSNGDSDPGLKLWARLAEQGVTEVAVESSGASPVDLAVAFERLGYHAVPGPWVESAAFLPVALSRDLSGAIATVAVYPHCPLALDADVAETAYLVDERGIALASVGLMHDSVDRSRRLFELSANESPKPGSFDAAFDIAVLAVSAQLLGLGERLLDDSVSYVKQRKQFGRQIGSYQAIKHQLADVRIALDFARPLVFGAALGALPASVAKIACGDAAYKASRVGLQVHGAVGYTQELDLSIWITKVRALLTSWGTPGFHRDRVLAGLL